MKVKMNELNKKTISTLVLTIMLVAALPLASLIPTAYAAAAITLSPTSGPCGTEVTVTGTGYKSQAAITLTFGGLTITITSTWTTTSTGAIPTGSTFTVPGSTALPTAPGAYTVIVSDAAGNSASATFTITSVTMSIYPTSGPSGDTILVQATGFLPDSYIAEAKFGGEDVTLSPNNIVDEDGAIYVTFPSESLPTPTTYPSNKYVVLTDESGNIGKATFSLTKPSITLSSSSGAVADTVTVTGSGFMAGGTVTLQFDATPLTSTKPTTIKTTASGTFVARFDVPSALAGAHTVYAYDGTVKTETNVASATFTVKPSISVNMGTTSGYSGKKYVPKGQPDTKVKVSGSGFAASSALEFIFAGPVTPDNEFTATTSDAYGTFTDKISDAVNWPDTAGTYSLTITDDSGNSAYATIVATATGKFWVLSKTSGPVGTSVMVTYFGADPAYTGELEDWDAATTEWSTAEKVSGSYSAKLTTTSASGYAFVRVYPGSTGIMVNNLLTGTNIPTFKYWLPTGTTVHPDLELRFTSVDYSGGTAGSVDITIYQAPWATTADQWNTAAGVTGTNLAVCYGNDPVTNAPWNSAGTLTEVIAYINAKGYGGWNLYRVSPQFGDLTGNNVVYIDDIKVGATTFTLEPSDIKVHATSTGLAVYPTAAAYPTPKTTTFVVPNVLPGVGYSVTGTGGWATCSAPFTVTTATPTMTLSPTSGPKLGGPVTITASGFISGASITYTFAGTTLATTTTSVVSGAVIATFDVPPYVTGTHTVALSDGTNTASATFTITAPSVTPVISTIKSDTTMIKANLAGFASDSDLTITLGGQSATITMGDTTDLAGKAYCTFTSPSNVPGGSQKLVITDASGNKYSTTVTAVPKITLTPKAAEPSTEITLTGTGFGDSKTLTLKMNTTSVTLYTDTTAGVTTTSVGEIPDSVTFTVPSTLTTGAYTVTVTDSDYPANTATAKFTVSAPVFTMTPSSGSAGITITVTGTGWIPSVTAEGWIKFDTTTVLIDGDTDSYGRLKPLTGWRFDVPLVAAGSHTVTVSDGTLERTATFTVITPSITLSATSGNVGGIITITGSGFTPAAGITGKVYFGATAVALETTSVTAVASDGTLGTGVKIAVPTGSVAGNYTIKLLFTSPDIQASQTFTVIPKISVSPTTGFLRGTEITVTGKGFAASKDITVTIAGTTIVLSATETEDDGIFSGTYTLPIDQTTGASILIVTDAAGNSASKTITVGVPTVTLSPSSGAAGTTVQVTGTGFFPADVTYIIAFDGVVQTTSPPSLTSETGSAIGFFTVPTTAATGTHTVALTDTNGNTASATFTVTTVAAAAVDSATLSSTAGTVNPTTGTTQTSFARGTSVKNTFVLKTTTGTANVIWKITFQQPDLSVYNIVTTSASVSTTPSTISMEQLLPSTAQTGTWTATVQIFASDGVTPLAVTTVTFAVTAS